MLRMVSRIMVGAFLVGALSISTQAKPLWIELFDDLSNWTVIEASAGDVVAGDFGGSNALCVQNSQGLGGGGWGTLLHSNATFPRGSNVRVSFQVWSNGPGANSIGFNGGWHSSPHTGATGHELVVGRWLTGGAEGGESFETWGKGELGGQGGMAVEQFDADFAAATSRADAIVVRVHLGDVADGHIVWSTSAGDIYDSANDNFTAEDGMNLAVTSHLNATDTPNNHIGFWGVHDPVYIDNIVVENDSNLVPVELSEFSAE